MFHIALYQPEIPPNTGNIIRLTANCGQQLHLIHPLGFDVNEKQCRRAGLDYHALSQVKQHEDYASFQAAMQGKRIFACSTKGKTRYSDVSFQAGDVLLFGPETRGLPTSILESLPSKQVITIPMVANSRSLNLANAVAIITYEAWRQYDFCGSTP